MAAAERSAGLDPYHICKYFEPLRVVDVADAMDHRYFNIGLIPPKSGRSGLE